MLRRRSILTPLSASIYPAQAKVQPVPLYFHGGRHFVPSEILLDALKTREKQLRRQDVYLRTQKLDRRLKRLHKRISSATSSATPSALSSRHLTTAHRLSSHSPMPPTMSDNSPAANWTRAAW